MNLGCWGNRLHAYGTFNQTANGENQLKDYVMKEKIYNNQLSEREKQRKENELEKFLEKENKLQRFPTKYGPKVKVRPLLATALIPPFAFHQLRGPPNKYSIKIIIDEKSVTGRYLKNIFLGRKIKVVYDIRINPIRKRVNIIRPLYFSLIFTGEINDYSRSGLFHYRELFWDKGKLLFSL